MQSKFQHFLVSKAIAHERSCPNTLQQNGVVEQNNHHLLEID